MIKLETIVNMELHEYEDKEGNLITDEELWAFQLSKDSTQQDVDNLKFVLDALIEEVKGNDNNITSYLIVTTKDYDDEKALIQSGKINKKDLIKL